MDSVRTDCVELQMEEIEVLRSMYNPGELVFATSQSNNEQFELGSSFVLRIDIESFPLDISIQFPLHYPICKRPIVFIRSTEMLNDTSLNCALRAWINQQELETPLVMEIVMWLHENVKFFNNSIVNKSERGDVNMNTESLRPVKHVIQYTRYWIFSHHLFSSTKRSNIMKLAKESCLTGFATPGKPAIVVIEGTATACKEFWLKHYVFSQNGSRLNKEFKVKSWQWQKINLRHSEEIGMSMDCFKFKDFREIILPSSDHKHVKIGAVKTMLSELGLEDKFNIVYDLKF